MNRSSVNQSGFSVVEAFLILVVFGLIGFVGWYVYSAKQHTDASLTAAAKASTTAVTNSKRSPTPTKNYLTISDWGVRIPMPKEVTTGDIYYAMNSQNTSSSADAILASHKLSSIATSCDPSVTHEGTTPFGSVERLTPAAYQAAVSDPQNSGVTSGTHLGDYYYAWQVPRANCAGIPGQDGATEANQLMNSGLDNFPTNMTEVLKGIETLPSH